MSENTKLGAVHSIETFGSVDGPGVRYVIFYRDVRCAANIVTMQIPGKSFRPTKVPTKF